MKKSLQILTDKRHSLLAWWRNSHQRHGLPRPMTTWKCFYSCLVFSQPNPNRVHWCMKNESTVSNFLTKAGYLKILTKKTKINASILETINPSSSYTSVWYNNKILHIRIRQGCIDTARTFINRPIFVPCLSWLISCV